MGVAPFSDVSCCVGGTGESLSLPPALPEKPEKPEIPVACRVCMHRDTESASHHKDPSALDQMRRCSLVISPPGVSTWEMAVDVG